MEQYFIFNSTIYGHGSLWVYPNEAPFAYKDYEEIMRAIEPTVDIIERLIPIYNYKAAED